MDTMLITSIGKRVQLIKHLKKNFKVIGVDAGDLVPARYFVDKFYRISKVFEENYIKEIIDICKKENVKILIPLYDGEFDILNRNRYEIEKLGVKLCLSNSKIIDICKNKEETDLFFKQTEINIPKRYSNNEIERIIKNEDVSIMPLFIKPIDGMGSQGIFKINDINELSFFTQYIKGGIVQEYICGEEYTVDCLVDFNGNPVYIIPRKRIEVRSGEVVKTQSVHDELLINQTKKVIDCLNKLKDESGVASMGPLTIQFFKTKRNEIFLLEINPRFGGGVPLAFECGADYGKALRDMLNQCELKLIDSFEEKMMLRYDDAVFINTDKIYKEVSNVRKEKLFIFDLDDTLYYEKEFVLCGFKEVCEYLAKKYKLNLLKLYCRAKEILEAEGRGKIFDILCDENKINEDIDKLVEIYRNTKPKLILYKDSDELLKKIRNKGKLIGLITDGYSKVQWNKIKALKLENRIDKIIVTNDYGENFEKPNQRAYLEMIDNFNLKPNECVYIGDNPKKDFIGAKNLGMNTIRIKREKGDHIRDIVSKEYEADYIIDSFEKLNIEN